MKIVIIYSQVAPNLYEIIFSVEHKKKVLCYPLTPIGKTKKLVYQWIPSTVWLPTFFKI